ncbi:MAG: patatin family protein [Eubacterium sp.]|nr:patatin family protein [Eubacterium sp.]
MLGLVLEGGAMRGMFTAGVTDVMLENDIAFDGAVGVSAGAVFGCNYKSRQPGRVIRYNTAYCNDKRYCSLSSLIKTGDLYGEQFCYHDIPERLDIFDVEAYRSNPMAFYAVCTDVESGEAVYKQLSDGSGEDLQWMRASASMPLVSRIVELEGKKLLDGGIADSIPLRFFEGIGYNRNVLILTRPADYVKEKNIFLPMMKIAMRKYPKFMAAVADRHIRYNETLDYIRQREQSGETFVIRPEAPLNIGSTEHDPDELKRVYRLGRDVGEKCLPALKEFIKSKD